jgi:hypothetical protein
MDGAHIPSEVILILYNHVMIQRILFAWTYLQFTNPRIEGCTPVE